MTIRPALADAVDVELAVQLADLPAVPRRGRARLARPQRWVRVRRDLDEAAEVANRCAPEHLQVAVAERTKSSSRRCSTPARSCSVSTPRSPPANFVIGCPASLPTSGFAKVSSGITADTFLKRTAVARADRARWPHGALDLALAEHEGFPAHANATRRRFDRTTLPRP